MSKEASTEVAAASPTATATPSPAAQPVQAKSGNFNDFESPTTWKRGDQPYGTFERSTANAHSGSSAGQLKYDFPAVSDNFVVFLTQQPLSGQPEQFSAWVNGDGSGHFLNTWVKDSAGDVWQFTFGQINHTGWRQMVAPLDPAGDWPVGVISGNSTKKAIDYPINFQALILDGVPDGAKSSGSIYIDDLTSGTTLTEEPATDTSGSESAASINSGQYLLQLGNQHLYQEPWGGDNGNPCRAWETGVFDDTNPNFRGFNVELVLTNNSSSKISDDWAENLFFVTANGAELAACYFTYDGMGPPPGASSSVTFFTVVSKGDYVNLVDLLLEDEEIRLCLDGKGGSSEC